MPLLPPFWWVSFVLPQLLSKLPLYPQYLTIEDGKCSILQAVTALTLIWAQVTVLPLLLFSVLAKLFPNSLLASLNERSNYRKTISTERSPSWSGGMVSTSFGFEHVRCRYTVALKTIAQRDVQLVGRTSGPRVASAAKCIG